MKKTLHFSLFAFATCILYACAHSTIPQIQIPEQKGELDVAASLGIGSSGLHANAIYALSDHICVQGALNYFGTTFYREAGLGIKNKNGTQLLSLTYGRAEYEYSPIIFGGSGIYVFSGHFDKYALTANTLIKPDLGMIARLAYLDGRETGEDDCISCHPYFHLPFSRLYFEPSIYFKLGKRKHLFFSISGRIPLSQKGQTGDGEAFYMSYLQYNVGYTFGMFKKPRLK